MESGRLVLIRELVNKTGSCFIEQRLYLDPIAFTCNLGGGMVALWHLGGGMVDKERGELSLDNLI